MTTTQRIFSPGHFAMQGVAPLYLRIKKLVTEAVACEELKQGDAIPSERDVADMLGVSRVTVRKAFTELDPFRTAVRTWSKSCPDSFFMASSVRPETAKD